MSELSFPDNFLWGAATAAYQIEGAARDDGRGDSIWDTFSRTPGKVHAGHTGDVACDHYHRYADDVAMMAELGLQAYRFSVSWPRIQPDGSGPVNPRGLDFYDRLTDALLGRGIDPIVTLYHWDLPQTLQDRGGWTDRDTAEHFATYASAVHTRLGDRIDTWTTLNEPWCSAYLGYGNGVHAPGVQDAGAAFSAVHHLLLAHGLAAQALRTGGAARVGITLNPADVQPADADSAADAAAVRLVDGLHNRIFLDPLLVGGYPDDVREHVARLVEPTFVRDGDEKIIAAPIDLLGINYYSPTYVAGRPDGGGGGGAYPGTEGAVEFLPAVGPLTDMGWMIEPAGLTRLLTRIAADYPGVPLLITENGAAFPDKNADPTSPLQDSDRVAYLDGHLRAAHEAIARGVDLRGYLVWSLLDNFEWAEGYRKRFGIVHVDYLTQRRTPKASARWYQEVISRNGL
ncbi:MULTISPECIES: GH1 family beta-glucosidase [unclassified Micromonospora]|uniref:GH1 family beta-glucosidase n=1 Tax=unclassified Micromonospora TaxID=2617518 RepID=UPI001033E100|nr:MULTISPECIES: GH1 family beta-glucosidase [unclassified Micromonospora]QKW16475.1 beta-glucosidase [Verrucosispora sp. NA02020]TBL42758.1 beta-glucosidase [Verrucosispora sp. SN26_14.1]